MIKRMLATLAVSLLAIFGLAAPASAAALHSCPDDFVCLYQWTNYGAGRWQTSFYNLSIHSNGCINISPAAWPNGTPVDGNSGSMVINGSGAYSALVYITIYNGINCSSIIGATNFAADRQFASSNLSNVKYDVDSNAYHTISSVKISTTGPPPA